MFSLQRFISFISFQTWRFATLISMFIFVPLMSHAAEAPSERLNAFLAKTKSLTAHFKQVTLDEQLRPTQTSEGEFYLQRPGKFRWEYHKPYTQQIVANGSTVWFYDADLAQVTIKPLERSIGSTPALLLSGEGALDRDFSIDEQGYDGDMVWIRLRPKAEDATFRYILVGMEGQQLAGMELSDHFGQLTRIFFSNLQRNVVVPPERFELKLPPGVDVFHAQE